MTISDLICEIDAYAAARGLSPSTVVSRAVSNGRLYGRLMAGFGCHLETAERIRAYMAANPTSSPDGPRT